MARKARIEDLGKPVEPAVNGGRAAPAEAAAPSMGHIASAFPPIAEYAFLSDCEVNALIAPSGRVEWMCLPRPDSPSVFAAILDRASGAFRFAPSGVMVPAGRRYLPGTLVLETTWRTRTGWLIVRDCLCIGPWYHSQRRSGTHRRPPTDQEAEHILLRTAKCVVGSVELSLDCHPVFDYGKTAAHWEYSGPGYGEAVARGGDGDVPLRLVTDLRMGFEGPGAHATKTLRQGEKAYVALAWPRSQYSATSEFWAEHPPPASATGTIATRGSVTGPSCSGAFTRSASHARPTISSTSSPTWRPGSRTCRSCTGSAASTSCPSAPWTTSAATRDRGPCASATPLTHRSSTTCGARCSTPYTCTPSRGITCPRWCGRSSSAPSKLRSRTGGSPTVVSGRCVASRSTSRRRS